MGAEAWVAAAAPWLAEAEATGRVVADAAEAWRVEPTPNPSDPNAPQPEPITVADDAIAAARAHVDADPAWFAQLYPLVAERLTRLDEIPAKLAFLFWGAARPL